MPAPFRPVFIAFSLLLASGCASAGGDHWVRLDGHRYAVEVANTEDSRERGLMFRDSLPADRGMLFIHEQEMPLAYWMKNTRIPLDILFFDNELRLVTQQRDVPPCTLGDRCPPYPSTAPARYVLELNAGQAASIGLKDGDRLDLGPDMPPPQ